jgi:hypothetical protein
VRDRWKHLGPTVRSDVTLTQAIRAVVDAKTASGKSQEYVTALRETLGFTRWPKDVTRHTAASYWLAEVQNAPAVAEVKSRLVPRLGHNVLHGNHLGLELTS